MTSELLTDSNISDNVRELEQSIVSLRQAVHSLPNGNPDLHHHLYELGNLLREHHLATNGESDPTEALSISREAVKVLPADNPMAATYLNNLGRLLRHKFDFERDPRDLDEAVEVFRRSVDLSKDDPSWLQWLTNLGNSIYTQYNVTRSLSASEESINMAQKLLESSPEKHTSRSTLLHLLAGSFSDRHVLTGAMDDLNGISCFLDRLLLQHPLMGADIKSLEEQYPDLATNFNRHDMIEYVKTGTFRSDEALQWLWDCVASPVLSALGFEQPPSEGDWPHVWWIMTGLLNKFPIHAAGHHSKGFFETVIDRVISSYNSSIRSIIRVESEEPEPNRDNVLTSLLECGIFHFAGHACTDPEDPIGSYLCLDQEREKCLTVLDLLDINLQSRSPFLAYLSACGTGRIGNNDLADEGIHLINGFHTAGFRHVIGTLWEVKDEICVDMARITYEGIMQNGMTDKAVSQGLHNASRELRDRWVTMASADHRTVGSSQARGGENERGDGGENERRGHEGFSRDIVTCDDEPVWPPWIPYIHYGV
ncbi:CHAT domain-containing protein [Fusarium redolens]|uniref:CHAT domain-containing protein n=1 Tax=Fusarium redolens TaxID=48865 RepID=A0A9P9FWF9_FUSRE|nr:CHAT domain-containing protein [Fusarium redolens]KAH7203117.1 CHAT domain-containing protein [Fusarium redolens]